MIELIIGFGVGSGAYFVWQQYGAPWLAKRKAYKRRVTTRKAKKVKGGANAQDN